MDPALRERLELFVKPLYQDLDGVSRFDDVSRIGRLARAQYKPVEDEERLHFELLILFHRLGGWLARLGNASRVVFASGGMLSEPAVRRLQRSLERLDAPESGMERAVAAAIAVDSAGVRGAVLRLAQSRREGQTQLEEARQIASEAHEPPLWMDSRAAEWFARRAGAARRVAEAIVAESDLDDLPLDSSGQPQMRTTPARS